MKAEISTAVLALSIALQSATAAQSPQALEVSDRTRCGQCQISFSRIIRIGGELDSRPVIETPLVEQDSRGRYYVASYAVPYEIHVYDVNGKFLEAIGTKGQGPGEYRYIRDIRITAGDSLRVFDIDNLRYTVMGPDYKIARSVRLPFARYARNTLIPSRSGGFLINAIGTNASSAGFPLHVFDRRGRLLDSFGSDGSYKADLDLLMYRQTAPSRAGGVWSAHLTQYLVERWAENGIKHQEIVRKTSWFEPWFRPVTPSTKQPSLPTTMGLREDNSGKLWVIVQVPDARQREALTVRRDAGEAAPVFTDIARAYDTMLEVIDVDRATLVISKRLDELFVKILNDSTLVSYGENRDGVGYLDIWRARLTMPQHKR